MDAYAYVLDQLSRDDFRRLRGYTPQARTKFTTWLVVVARRLCVDRLRERYGRGRERGIRRRVAELLADELDPAATPDRATPLPDAELEARELTSALANAIGRLDARDRLLLKLRYERELSAREIGQILHFPTPFHVYRRLNALLEQLKRDLEP
jgi:RNA polymerase sigma factor (sigma-70 family)